jgi:hypothetical protein
MRALNQSVVVVALGLGLWVGLAAGGCTGGDCDCSQADLPPISLGTIVDAIGYGAQSRSVPPLVDPSGGTIAVLGDSVEIRYDHDGAEITVTYDVGGPSRR